MTLQDAVGGTVPHAGFDHIIDKSSSCLPDALYRRRWTHQRYGGFQARAGYFRQVDKPGGAVRY